MLPEVPPIDSRIRIRYNENYVGVVAYRPAVMISLGCDIPYAVRPRGDPSDSDTIEAGAMKRFLTTTPLPDLSALDALNRFVISWCKKNLIPLSRDVDTSVESWLTKTNYPKARQEQLLKIWVESGGHLKQKDYHVKSFVKDESYDEFKHVRLINSRSDLFKCQVGPIFKLIEEVVFKNAAFIKKVPIADRPAFIRQRLERDGAKYFYGDFSAFESHFGRLIMQKIEFVMYLYMTQYIPEYKKFSRILNDVIAGKNVCKTKMFKIFVEARRMSGEMNTSLGNGFTNLMLLLFLFEQLGEEIHPVVEGDDSATSFMHRCPTADDFKKLGFTIKCGTCDNFEELSFCGMVFDPIDLVNVTDPHKVLASFGWEGRAYTKYTKRKLMALLRCKSLSYLYQYPGCPIIQSLANYGLRCTRSYDVRRFVQTSRTLSVWDRELYILAMNNTNYKTFVPVPYRTRLLVERLYGINISQQIRVEKYLDSLSTLTQLRGPISELNFPEQWCVYSDMYTIILPRNPSECDYPPIHWARMK